MQNNTAYNTIGSAISSQIASAPRAVFGSAGRDQKEKMVSEEVFMKSITGGK